MYLKTSSSFIHPYVFEKFIAILLKNRIETVFFYKKLNNYFDNDRALSNYDGLC
jgi:hypothetical protein